MTLKIYNTLTNKKEEFVPLEDGKVRLYVCGPTVYSDSHIGHARSAVSFDVIFKYLRHIGFEVNYTRNYTDIDDKIINRANKDGEDWKVVANRYIKSFDADMAALDVELPTNRPRATESIKKMIELIETLIKKGFAYNVGADVFYSVRKFKDYGKLSGKIIEDLESGARVEVDTRKEDPLDFALWKSSKDGEPSWDSPWGKGRPGWHIECSAMCLEWLGETIDIHGGGKDLIFPHHENEIAQSEAATNKPFARFWMHNGFVNIEKEKMSKSLGNILNISDALEENTAESIRLFLLSSQYRSPIDYSSDTLTESEAKAERFYRTLKRIEETGANPTDIDEASYLKKVAHFDSAMDDDFNTAAAIGKVFEEVSEVNRALDKAKKKNTEIPLKELGATWKFFQVVSSVLGVFAKTPQEYFSEIKERAGIDTSEVEKLIEERLAARAAKDFAKADAIRDTLSEKGVLLEDRDGETFWTIK
jgi:cysteinyl-tRNA synthetase